MRLLAVTLCTIGLLADSTIAQSFENNFFINPAESTGYKVFSQNVVWQWGYNSFLQWRSEWENLNLKLYQNDNPAFWIVTPDDVHGSGVQGLNYNSTFPLVQLDYSLPLVFFFRMNNVDDDSQTFSSQYFNLTAPPPPPITTSSSSSSSIIPSPTPIPSPAAAAAPSPSPSATIAPSPTPTRRAEISSQRPHQTSAPPASATQDVEEQSTSEPSQTGTSTEASPEGGLSTGLAAGIGIGAGLGALILIALIIGVLYYRRKAKKAKAARRRAKDASDEYAAAWEAKADRSTYSTTHRPRYYEQQREPVELPYNEPRGAYYNPQELP